MIKWNTEKIIQCFIEVQGEFYNYDRVVYKNMKENVIIKCPIHGDFLQSPDNHKRGKGCNECGYIKMANKRILDFDNILKLFRDKHDFFFDYDKTTYVNNKTKMVIICPIHGEFKMSPMKHKDGRGCPKCTIENYDEIYKNNGGWSLNSWIKKANTSIEFDSYKIYIIKLWDEYEVFYKIGRTFQKTKRRFCRLKHYNWEIISEKIGSASEIYNLERDIHKQLEKYKYKPIHKFDGYQECYSNTPAVFVPFN